MTEKVKIPQEVADAIEKMKEVHTNYGVVQALESGRRVLPNLLEAMQTLRIWTHEEEGNGRNADRLLDALVNDYDIEQPPIKVGDWVTEHKGDAYRVGKVNTVNGDKMVVGFMEFAEPFRIFDSVLSVHDTSKSTPCEVSEEKERRKWAEIEPGDVIINPNGRLGKLVRYEVGASKVTAETLHGVIQSWEKSTCELYAKKVGEAND